MKQWNPKYTAFAKSQGRTPEEQTEVDFPSDGSHGLGNLNFMSWVDRCKVAFDAKYPPLRPYPFIDIAPHKWYHKEFDEFCLSDECCST